MTDSGETPRPYHHGDLRVAMLEAAERILERLGIPGLTLRAAAREAGASHAAPKNHFGDLSGLLSDLAAVGFTRFAAGMRTAADAETTPQGRLDAIGRAYVAFAVANPALFQLMFRGERLDAARPALRDAMREAFGELSGAIGAARHEPAGTQPALVVTARMVGAWSLVHGFAMLLLDGRLAPVLERLQPGTDAMALLDMVLRRDDGGPPGARKADHDE